MKHAIAAALMAGASLFAIGAHAAPPTITLDGAALDQVREAAKGADLQPALEALIARADKLLDRAPETVTAKGVTPPSGDKHDYLSIGPYWWPNPETTDGLPYIRKDGETNPASKNDDTDSARIQRMCSAVLDLALAYHFTGEEKYAAKSADYIRTWFLDPATLMNPNLRFGQAVPGLSEGRGIGLIDTRNFWKVIDASLILSDADKFSEADEGALRQWFARFLDWMLTSPQGHEEYVWHNNHGAYYDAQIANFALFAGDEERAASQIEDAIHLRMANHFAKDGKQYAELERTRPFHYSMFNLIAHLQLARYGDQAGVDYRGAVQDGRSLKQGVAYMMQQAGAPDPAIFTADEKVFTPDSYAVVLQAARDWGEEMVDARLLAGFAQALPADPARLLWPDL